MFRALGEHVAASVRRGQRVVVLGTLAIKRWEAGEKSGTDAEIDALAVGHDLAFGTTVFTGTSRPREEARPVEADAEWAPAGSVEDSADDRVDRPQPVATPF